MNKVAHPIEAIRSGDAAPARADSAAFLHETAEWCDPGAGPDHDDIRAAVRQTEMLVRLQPHPYRTTGLEAIGNMG